MELPPKEYDQILGNAARFLIEGQEEDAASVLLSCSLSGIWEDIMDGYVTVELTGPRAAYDTLSDPNNPIHCAVFRALNAVTGNRFSRLDTRVELVEISPDWREELLEIARGKSVHNQATEGAQARVWNNLRFRSESEIKIAQALDRAGLLFLPNCRARLGPTESRANKEADFLICWEGKWGILEVDGEPFHPPSRTAKDHERDRLFKTHGIRVVEHFDATKCFEDPNAVVQQFLEILKKS